MKPRNLLILSLVVLTLVAVLIWQGRKLNTTNIFTSDNNTESADNISSKSDAIFDLNPNPSDEIAKVGQGDISAKMGSIVGYSYGDCIGISNNSLKKGDKVQLILPDAEEPQKILETTVEGPVKQENECGPWFIEPGGLLSPYQSFYKLATKNYSISIAIIGSDFKSQIK